MSVAGISSSSLFDFSAQSTQNGPSKVQQFKQEFQQLGQDLQSDNLSAAQTDFANLQKPGQSSSSSSSSQTSSPIQQALNQLSQDLQSGNLSGAQQDYSQIQQDIQNRVAQSQGQGQAQGHHHHHHGGGSTEASAINQAFQQLGQALQSGNLTTAQQAYSTLQQDLPQLGQSSAQQTTASSQPSSTGVSVTV
jgi:outer membrane protein assembly factor BamD (BamD/ComL family)